MKKSIKLLFLATLVAFIGCKKADETSVATSTDATTQAPGQEGVKDETSNPNIVQVAIGSKDHTTLVAAVKAAGLVDILMSEGPFTVFAPTNAAFDKLPKETVETLLKPENKEILQTILKYQIGRAHV